MKFQTADIDTIPFSIQSDFQPYNHSAAFEIGDIRQSRESSSNNRIPSENAFRFYSEDYFDLNGSITLPNHLHLAFQPRLGVN